MLNAQYGIFRRADIFNGRCLLAENRVSFHDTDLAQARRALAAMPDKYLYVIGTYYEFGVWADYDLNGEAE